MNYLIYLCISLFQSCFNSANFKCQLAPYTFLPLPWHFKIRKLKAILEYPIINKCRYFEITYLVATLIYKARGISSCSLRVPIHHKVLRWHWLVHGYWCLSSCVCLTMDFWTSYNNFITCFHESWIYETWIFSIKFLVCFDLFKLCFQSRIKIHYKMAIYHISLIIIWGN